MTGSEETYRVAGVSNGQLGEAGEDVLLTFQGPGGPVRLALPKSELMALVSVCIGLAGQDLPEAGGAELATIPVADWRVGVTSGGAIAMGLAPEAGGALAFHLTPRQAEEMAAALVRGVRLAQADHQAPHAVRGRH